MCFVQSMIYYFLSFPILTLILAPRIVCTGWLIITYHVQYWLVMVLASYHPSGVKNNKYNNLKTVGIMVAIYLVAGFSLGALVFLFSAVMFLFLFLHFNIFVAVLSKLGHCSVMPDFLWIKSRIQFSLTDWKNQRFRSQFWKTSVLKQNYQHLWYVSIFGTVEFGINWWKYAKYM